MIRKATISDLDAIVSIKDATVEIFKAEDNPQWDSQYPTRESFEQDIAGDSLYVYERDDGVVGFACINQDEPDEYLALEWNYPKPALFLHRVAIDPTARKSGVASEFMAFTENLARANGAKAIRTDTCSRNVKMQGLFSKAGYARVPGVVHIRGLKVDFYCFELPVKPDNLPHITPLQNQELPPAIDLVWDVFSEFEAPEYSERGIAEFRDFIALGSMRRRIENGELVLWGCHVDNLLVGVAALKNGNHISLLFVDGRHHKKGYGRLLFNAMKDYAKIAAKSNVMTVHSSPYALEAYRRLGFVETAPEQLENGLRFIPMRLEIGEL